LARTYACTPASGAACVFARALAFTELIVSVLPFCRTSGLKTPPADETRRVYGGRNFDFNVQ